VAGQNRSGLARLSPSNGALIGNSGAPGIPAFDIGTGSNGDVLAITVLADGRIAVGGNFTRFNSGSLDNRNGVALLTTSGGLEAGFAPPAGKAEDNENNTVRSIVEQSGKLVTAGWLAVRPRLRAGSAEVAETRAMWLTETRNTVQVDFSRGKLEDAPLNPDALFRVSAKNTATYAGTGNSTRTTMTLNPATGMVSGQFTPDNGGIKRTVKYTALLVPVTASDMRGAGSFDLPALPNGTIITSKNAPIETGKVVIAPQP
jgi:hypothetical protein